MERKLQVLRGTQDPHTDQQPEERDLILAAQQGDASAYKKLYEQYNETVYNLAAYSLRDPSQTEDVFQTVFVKAYEALPQFRLESSFLTWICRITINECKNRKRARRLFLPIHELAEDPVFEGATPDAQQASKQMKSRVRRALMQLKPKYRAVVVLKYIEELSYEEIAAVLDCSLGTVASRLHRALAMLESNLRGSGKTK